MKHLLPIFLIALLLSCEPAAFDEEAARQQILKLEQLQRHVHFAADAETFAQLLAEPHLSVNRGQVGTSSRSENQERFQAYFESVHFVEWDNLAEPIVRFSADGTLAYSVLQKRVTVQYPTDQGLYHGSTDFAWTSIYRRTGDSWEIESVTSTNQESRSDYLKNVMAVADCQGPEGAYTTELAANANGFLEFRQRYTYRDAAFAAQVDRDSLVQELTPNGYMNRTSNADMISMLQGHNFFWMYLQPDLFFKELEADDPWHWHGVDALGNPVELKRDSSHYQVQVIELRNPFDTKELIEVQYLTFDSTAFGPLPRTLRVVQDGRDTFSFQFREVRLNVEDFPVWVD